MIKQKDLISIYKEATEIVIKNSEKYFINSPVYPVLKKILKNSSEFMINKWRKKKKYLRTWYVIQVFGDSYPKKILKKSLFFDALTNILDDLFDEALNFEERKMYILEMGKILSFLFRWDNFGENDAASAYFQKLIFMGIGDTVLREHLKRNNDIDLAKKIYELRSMDIDIFIDLVLQLKKLSKKKELKNYCRIFRALNLIKKDILDIHHDEKIGQDTPVIIFRNQPEKIKKLVSDLTSIHFPQGKEYQNLERMIRKEKNEILKLLKNF